MKKQLLTIVALLFAAVTAMAQVELGAPKWNIKDGAKVSLTKIITLSFPNIIGDGLTAGSSLYVAWNFVAAGEESDESELYDTEVGVNAAVEIPLIDYDVQEKTTYSIIVKSVKIDGVQQLAEGDTLRISFTTRGAERQMLWTFTIDSTSVDKIKADDGNVEGGEGEYWLVLGVDTRHYVHQKLNNEEIMLDANTPLPMTEGLNFTFGADKVYVGDVVTTKHKDRLSFNANNLYMTVPDCKVGDIITINANRATKPNAKKFTCIVAMDGAAEAIDGETSSSGMKDSLQLSGNFENFKFTVLQDGDVTLKFSNALVKSLEIKEARPIVDCKYSVKAIYQDGDNVKELKTLVPETVGKTNDVVKVNYSYWLTDGEGNLYTYGTKGNEFLEKFDLISDTTFVIKYKSTGIGGVVYLAEMEDLVNADDLECPVQLLTTGNEAVRASNGKAAYVTSDYTITTVPAGTYKIYAGVFDKTKGGGSNQTFKVGEEEIIISSTSDNLSIVESSPFTVTEDNTPVVWLSNGSTQNGIDMIAIYATDDVPEEEPDGVSSVEAKANVTKAVRKVVNNGQLLIEGANGTFNVAGAQVK